MSSHNETDGEQIPLPTFALNMAHLREQIAGAPPARLDDYTMAETDLNESTRTSSVITSTSGQDNGQSCYRTQDDVQMNGTRPKFTTCSNMINGIACNNCLPSEYCPNDKTNSSGTTEHTNLFLCSDNEINTTSSEDESLTVVTSASQQDNDSYKYNYWIQGDGQRNYNRPKFTTCSNTPNGNSCNCDLGDYSDDEVRITDNFGATNHTDLFQSSNDEMNSTNSDAESIGSTITAFSGEDGDYYWTDDDEMMNDTRSNFPTGINMTDAIAHNYSDPGEYNSDNGVKKTDCSGTNKPTKTSRDDENINTASISENSVRSTVITSVREQANGCFVYLTEYDEAMNETRSEVYNIEKPITTGSEEPLGSFIVTSAIRHPEQSSKSSEHVREPQIVIFGGNQNSNEPQNNSTGDDETDPNM